MNKFFFSTLIIVALLTACNSGSTQKNIELKTTLDSMSYSLGSRIAKNLMNDFEKQKLNTDLNVELFLAGMNAYLMKTEMKIPVEKSDAIVETFFKNRYEKAQELRNQLAKSMQDKFFNDTATVADKIVTLPSGLKYMIIEEGTGEKPTENSSVTTHYHGYLKDGKVFDSSVERGQPASFAVRGVIKGWTEALQLMKTGARYKLFIPSNLAYGERGAGEVIKPNTDLIFIVGLISIE